MTAVLQEAADRVMIGDLVARYGFFFDYGPAEAWSELFTPNANWEIVGAGIAVEGRAQLLRLITLVHQQPFAIHHVQTNHVVDIDGDRATGRVALNEFLLTPEQIHSNALGWYEDDYVRHNGRWLFQSRRIHLSANAMQLSTTGQIGEILAPMFARFGKLFPAPC